jgi:hypothetical protein
MGSNTKLKLKSFNSDIKTAHELGAKEVTKWLGANNNGKTTFNFELSVTKDDHKFSAGIDFLGVPLAQNKAAALNVLSDWMKRAASTIDSAIEKGDL